mgnify:CR=1 FL=1|tara:strand:- start:1233 stop:1598 length:366 start_codon:yes stop_codon:yes gene_type:complete
MNKTQKLNQIFKEIESRTDQYVYDFIEENKVLQIDDFDSLYDVLEDLGFFNVEIIYYARAIDYLKQNDPSLQFCMEIAYEFGYETKDINSELLASLLASRDLIDTFIEFEDKINNILKNYE